MRSGRSSADGQRHRRVYGQRNISAANRCLLPIGHTAAGVFKDLVVQVGERYLVRRTPLAGLYAVGNKIALLIAQRSAGRLVTRWVPALGALGVAGFVYVDTQGRRHGHRDVFDEIEIEDAEVVEVVAATKRVRSRPKRATAAGSETGRASTRRATCEENQGRTPGRVIAQETSHPASTDPAAARCFRDASAHRRERTQPGVDVTLPPRAAAFATLGVMPCCSCVLLRSV